MALIFVAELVALVVYVAWLADAALQNLTESRALKHLNGAAPRDPVPARRGP
jgi:hypothetical protein